jgi:hypothetical protein
MPRSFSRAGLGQQAQFIALPGTTARATVRALRMQGGRSRSTAGLSTGEAVGKAVKPIRGFDGHEKVGPELFRTDPGSAPTLDSSGLGSES